YASWPRVQRRFREGGIRPSLLPALCPARLPARPPSGTSIHADHGCACDAARHETSLCQRDGVESAVELRALGRTELPHGGEIDGRERIEVLYDQHGTELVARHGDWSASAWDPDGHGEHSVEAQVHALEHYVDSGGIALGAFAGGQLVGVGVVVPHLRPGTAQ